MSGLDLCPGLCEPEVVTLKRSPPPSPAPHTVGGDLARARSGISQQRETLRGWPLSQEAALVLSLFFCLPRLPPGAEQADSLSLSWQMLPVGWATGRRTGLGLGLWGDGGGCGPALAPAHLPPSQAQPLPSQTSLRTQDRPRGSRQPSCVLPLTGGHPLPVPHHHHPSVTHCYPGP